MSQNLISQTMSDTQRIAMVADLDAFDVKFASYKCLLTPNQIKHLSKLDAEDVALLDVALTFAQQNPGSVPADINVTELATDIALIKQVALVNAKTQQKADMTRCTLIAGLSDGFAEARKMYRLERAKGKNPVNATFLEAFEGHFGRGPQQPPAPPAP